MLQQSMGVDTHSKRCVTDTRAFGVTTTVVCRRALAYITVVEAIQGIREQVGGDNVMSPCHDGCVRH